MNTAEHNLDNQQNEVCRADFEYDYFDSQKYFDYELGKQYTRHNINIYNQLSYKGVNFEALYQTGRSFRNKDYSLPCSDLELSFDAQTDKTIVRISQLKLEDMQSDQDINNIIDFLKCRVVTSKEDLMFMFNAIKLNFECAKAYFEGLDFEPVVNRIFITDDDSVEDAFFA